MEITKEELHKALFHIIGLMQRKVNRLNALVGVGLNHEHSSNKGPHTDVSLAMASDTLSEMIAERMIGNSSENLFSDRDVDIICPIVERKIHAKGIVLTESGVAALRLWIEGDIFKLRMLSRNGKNDYAEMWRFVEVTHNVMREMSKTFKEVLQIESLADEVIKRLFTREEWIHSFNSMKAKYSDIESFKPFLKKFFEEELDERARSFLAPKLGLTVTEDGILFSESTEFLSNMISNVEGVYQAFIEEEVTRIYD